MAPMAQNAHSQTRFIAATMRSWRAFRRPARGMPPRQPRRREARRSVPARPAGAGNADFGEFHDVLVAIDADILSLPIGKRRGRRRDDQVADAADDDAVRM